MKIHYSIMITGMRESQMRPILAALKASSLKYELKADVDMEVPDKPNGKMHSRAESILTMTGKMPNKNSKLSAAREVFEKLEVRMGIGKVNCAAFRIELVKKKMSKGLAQRCVTEKVLAYL